MAARRSGFFAGAASLSTALRLLRSHSELWVWCALPFLVNLVAFALAVSVFWTYWEPLSESAAALLPTADPKAWYGWLWAGPLRVLAWVLKGILMGLLGIILGVIGGSNDVLAWSNTRYRWRKSGYGRKGSWNRSRGWNSRNDARNRDQRRQTAAANRQQRKQSQIARSSIQNLNSSMNNWKREQAKARKRLYGY